MNQLVLAFLWVLGLLTVISGLLYVLATIDPQTRPRETGRVRTG
jgi:hypothetical protein